MMSRATEPWKLFYFSVFDLPSICILVYHLGWVSRLHVAYVCDPFSICIKKKFRYVNNVPRYIHTIWKWIDITKLLPVIPSALTYPYIISPNLLPCSSLPQDLCMIYPFSCFNTQKMIWVIACSFDAFIKHLMHIFRDNTF